MTTAAISQSSDRTQSRSVVYSTGGIVATSHPLASQAGAMALARGGTAADAAIAANAVLGVVEPMMCGIGGDLFALYSDAATGKLHGLNASGWAPAGLTRTHLAAKGHSTMPVAGIDAVTVPGAVQGWAQLHARFGRLPWHDLFTPGIAFAADGHPVHEIIHSYWNDPRLNNSAEARRTFLPNGAAPAPGQLFRNPDLAQTLRLLAGEGPAAFYQGPIAQALLHASNDLGGTLAPADLAEFQAQWVEPISTTYKGWRVSELPPNGQGMAALIMLNIMEQRGCDLHTSIEAMKLAYSDVMAFNADPRFSQVPLAALLDKRYAARRASLISPRANPHRAAGAPIGSDTTYLAVVDAHGNIASTIQSIYHAWGSGLVVEGLGFPLQNRGAGFVLQPGHPNSLEPRKRPFHTIIPAFMQKDALRIGFGIMGGANQPLAHAQFVSNVADHGMNIQLALEAPRFTKLSPAGNDVQLESRAGDQAICDLQARGHIVERRLAFSTNMGRGAAVAFDTSTGVKQGAADPRGDGAATPQP